MLWTFFATMFGARRAFMLLLLLDDFRHDYINISRTSNGHTRHTYAGVRRIVMPLLRNMCVYLNLRTHLRLRIPSEPNRTNVGRICNIHIHNHTLSKQHLHLAKFLRAYFPIFKWKFIWRGIFIVCIFRVFLNVWCLVFYSIMKIFFDTLINLINLKLVHLALVNAFGTMHDQADAIHSVD